ncbi:MAG: lactonase family protein, partial [Verrucomicrobiia bacterium]
MTLSTRAGMNWIGKTALKGSLAIWLARGAAALTACACLLGSAEAASSCFVYVGTYTTAQSKGIYMFKFDTASGESSAPVLAAETRNASFLALSPDGRFLYAVNETDRFDGQPSGSVNAYAVDSKTGSLTLLNRVGTRGTGPCHLAVDPSGKCLVAANYGGGSVAAFPVRPDGTLGEAKSFIQHKGKSVNPRRQEGPHAHGATFDSEGRFVFVPDLGLDQILIYRVNAAEGSIMPHDPPFVSVAAGSGPRHLVFHPNGRFAYVINELANTVAVFEYDNAKGVLKHLQTASTLPDGYAGDNTT